MNQRQAGKDRQSAIDRRMNRDLATKRPWLITMRFRKVGRFAATDTRDTLTVRQQFDKGTRAKVNTISSMLTYFNARLTSGKDTGMNQQLTQSVDC